MRVATRECELQQADKTQRVRSAASSTENPSRDFLGITALHRGPTPNSTAAIANSRKICEDQLMGKYRIEVIDPKLLLSDASNAPYYRNYMLSNRPNLTSYSQIALRAGALAEPRKNSGVDADPEEIPDQPRLIWVP